MTTPPHDLENVLSTLPHGTSIRGPQGVLHSRFLALLAALLGQGTLIWLHRGEGLLSVFLAPVVVGLAMTGLGYRHVCGRSIAREGNHVVFRHWSRRETISLPGVCEVITDSGHGLAHGIDVLRFSFPDPHSYSAIRHRVWRTVYITSHERSRLVNPRSNLN